MKKFSIRDLENLSGIKTHTIRIWEHRYRILEPQRNLVNFRFYDLVDLKRLLDFTLLNRMGYKISILSKMNSSEIQNRISQLSNEDDLHLGAIHALIIYMYEMDTESFERVLNESVEKWKIDSTIENIIFPFMKRSGLMWHGKHLSEEHFVVTAIRKKMILGIELVRNSFQKPISALLFLPESKQLDLMLLYTTYQLKQHGIQVWYMGANVSVSNLKSVFEKRQPQFVYTYMHRKNNFGLEELSSHMNEVIPDSKLLITTYPEQDETKTENRNLHFMEHEEVLNFLLSN